MWKLDGDLEQRSGIWIVIVVVCMIMVMVMRMLLDVLIGSVRKTSRRDLGFTSLYCFFYKTLAAGK